MKKERLIKLILIGCLFVFGLGALLTGQERLGLVKDDGYKEQINEDKWEYLIVLEFDKGNIGECSIDVEFYDLDGDVIYNVDNTLLQIEDNIVRMYYEIGEEAEEYIVKNHEVYSSDGSVVNYIFVIMAILSILGLVGFNVYTKINKNKSVSSEKTVQSSQKSINILNKSKLSKKEPPKFEDLVKISDEHLRLAKEGKKDQINIIEARYLGYGIDLVNWARENLNMEFTFVESDIEKLDEIVKYYREKMDKDSLDTSTINGFIWGLAGVFGIITCHYKNARWLNVNDREYGHMLEVVYPNKIGGVTTNKIFIEAKANRLIAQGVEDETFISLYYSIPYEDGSLPFDSYTFEEYAEILKKEKNESEA